MKRFIVALLSLTLIFSLVACSGQNAQSSSGSGSSAEEETAVDAGTGGGGASAAAQGGRRRGGFMNWLRRLFRRR